MTTLKRSESEGFQMNAEIEKDYSRLLDKIRDLETRNSAFQTQLKSLTETTNDENLRREKGTEKCIHLKLKKKYSFLALQIELRKVQESRKEISVELVDLKHLIGKSENQKLIAMATKVELLANQLASANERYALIHQKCIVKEQLDANARNYAENLRERCEDLERQLADLKAKNVYKSRETIEGEVVVECAKTETTDSNNFPTADEVPFLEILQSYILLRNF